jgi:hypothetical protein
VGQISETTGYCATPNAAASTRGALCPRQTRLIDELCSLSNALDVVYRTVRTEIEENMLTNLGSLRAEFDTARDQVIAKVQEIAQHRSEHQC